MASELFIIFLVTLVFSMSGLTMGRTLNPQELDDLKFAAKDNEYEDDAIVDETEDVEERTASQEATTEPAFPTTESDLFVDLQIDDDGRLLRNGGDWLLSNNETMDLNITEDGISDTAAEEEGISDAGAEDEHSLHDLQQRSEYLRIRKKQEWLNIIRNQILERLGYPESPNITSPPVTEDERQRMVSLFERMRSQDQSAETRRHPDYPERVQSFYPTCTTPKSTDKISWEDPLAYHLYFNISWPRHPYGSVHAISTAKLRVFKRNLLAAQDEVAANCRGRLHSCSREALWLDNLQRTGHDERLRFSVLQYTRSLKRHRKLKKLVDSKMVAVNYQGWLEFDIRSAVKDWYDGGNHRNWGLEFMVEDSLEVSHFPGTFLGRMNCSDLRGTPFPMFADDSNLLGDKDNSAILGNETYPTLDLRLVEVPDDKDDRSNIYQRRRRHAHDICADPPKKHDGCCLQEVDVSMAELGWNFVVKPTSIKTGICSGNCHPHRNHGHQTSQCVPSKTRSLEVLYVNAERELSYMKIKDIIVEECRCLK